MSDRHIDRIEQELAPLDHDERSRQFQKQAFAYVLMMILLVGIWAITGAGYFWPVWPALIGAIKVGRRAYVTFAIPPEEPDELEE